MKRPSFKKGFTLVECVVAMALLAIMTLGLLMILSVTVKTRNSNMEIEREIDRQVEEIMQAGDASGIPYNEPIEFQDKNGDPAGAIPGDGQIITVSREDDVPDVVIGKLEYDYEAAVTSESVSSNEAITTTSSTTSTNISAIPNQQGNFKVYGGADIQEDTVTIKQYGDKTKMEGDTYTIAWQVEFTALTTAVEKSVKIVFPKGSFNINYDQYLSNCKVVQVGQYIERMSPKTSNGYTAPWSNVSAIFIFEISKANYEKNVGCIEEYFLNTYNNSGDDGKHYHIESASVKINTEY